MLVYRIEHSETNDGPYNGENCIDFDHYYGDDHPSPDNDGLDMYDYHKCGFKSKKQLHKWFNKEEIEKLHYYGFIMAIYNTPKGCTQISDNQLIFDTEYAHRISSHQLLAS